jgi:hypothetical protein
MSYRNIIANSGAKALESAMDAGAILHIHFVADPYKIHIAPHHRIEPKTAIITGDHIANDSRIGCNETIITKLRVFIFYG